MNNITVSILFGWLFVLMKPMKEISTLKFLNKITVLYDEQVRTNKYQI